MSLQGWVQALLVGFAVAVVALHAGETLLIGIQARHWGLVLTMAAVLLPISALLLWLAALHLGHGLQLVDVLFVLGGQLALGVCLPTRWLRRRKQRWDRLRNWVERRELEREEAAYYGGWDPSDPPVHPGNHRDLWPFRHPRERLEAATLPPRRVHVVGPRR